LERLRSYRILISRLGVINLARLCRWLSLFWKSGLGRVVWVLLIKLGEATVPSFGVWRRLEDLGVW
jgi:hypothetical protein